MLFQTEKLSSFHCCKLWILLYFFVNIESIASELRCEPPMPAPINGMVRCTKSNLIGSECYFGCKPGYELTSNSSSLCSYDFVRLITKWSPPSPPDCTLHQIVKKEDGCYGSSRIDMVFVLDGSGSIRAESFEHVKTWTKKVGELMIRVFDDHLHIGIVQFASKPQVEAKLQIFPNTAKFDVEVGGINQLRRSTYTVDAMNKALEVLNEDRPKCPFDYQRIMVLLTDGQSSQRSGLLNEAKILEDAGVISFAVGVEKANYDELEIIANGHKDRIFNVTDFDFLHETAHKIHAKIAQTLKITCDPPRTAPENGDVSCTHANELGSECTYTCDAGYAISNPLLLTTYCKIHTTAVGGWSSIPPTCIPIPGSVTGLTVVPQGPGKLNVSWTNPTGLFTSVEVTLNGETKSITDKSTTSQLFDGLSDGTSYTAQVTVKNNLISSGIESAIGITQPGSVTGLTVVPQGRGKLNVSWTNPTGLFTSVEVTLNGETKSITDKSTTSQLFDGLSDETSYTAQVTVKNDLISSGVESAIGITQCYGPSRIDMVFVLDHSASTTDFIFEHGLTWTKRVGELMIRVFEDHLHIGIVEFANRYNFQEYDVVVEGIRYLSGGTNTVDAMNKALEVLDEDRPKCPGDYQKIMVLITGGDGYEYGSGYSRSSQRSDLENEARILQDAGVISFAVGMEYINLNYDELQIIANGHKDRIFYVNFFDSLHETAHDVQVGIAQTLKITCDSPIYAPENGNVSCTHANELGSECTYTCDAGYKISDPLLSTTYCKIQTTGVGGWSSIPPTCIQITCDPPRTAPENGDVSCTHANELGSECTYTCDEGYFISNPALSTTDCKMRTVDVARWSNPPPTCISQSICEPPRTAPENGAVSCTRANELGSHCRYTCDEGYFISNPALSTTNCLMRTAVVTGWTRPPPTCIPTPNCEDKDPRCAMVQSTDIEMYCSYFKEMSRVCPKTCGLC